MYAILKEKGDVYEEKIGNSVISILLAVAVFVTSIPLMSWTAIAQTIVPAVLAAQDDSVAETSEDNSVSQTSENKYINVTQYEKSKQKSINQREYRAAIKGSSRKIKLTNAIDYAVAHSRTKKEFIERMNKLGYGVKWIDRYKYITYTTPQGQSFRDNKLPDLYLFSEC